MNTTPELPKPPCHWMKKVCRIVGWICLVVAFCWLLASAFCFCVAHRLSDTRLSATGTVTEVLPVISDVTGTELYETRIRFTAKDGQQYVVTPFLRSNPPRYTEGQTIELFYPRAIPLRAQPRHELTLYLFLMPCMFLLASLIHAALGGGLLYAGRRP